MASRRSALEWGAGGAMPAVLDVLIPTADRAAELAVTLAGLAAQDDPPFRVVVSDQSADDSTIAAPAVTAMVRVLAGSRSSRRGAAPPAPARSRRAARVPARSIAARMPSCISTTTSGSSPGPLPRMHDALQILSAVSSGWRSRACRTSTTSGRTSRCRSNRGRRRRPRAGAPGRALVRPLDAAQRRQSDAPRAPRCAGRAGVGAIQGRVGGRVRHVPSRESGRGGRLLVLAVHCRTTTRARTCWRNGG